MKTGYGRDGGTPADERAGQQGKTNIGLNYRVTPRLYIETVGDRRAENGISGEFCGFARFGRIDRSIQDVSSRPDMLCTFVTLDS